MYEVIARSESFIYILDRRYKTLTYHRLDHSPSQIANDFAGVKYVKGLSDAQNVLNNMLLEEQEDLNN